jgi:hypothetical protein
MRAKYITCITLTTGDISRSYRDEITVPEAMQWAVDALQAAARGERIELEPMGPGYTLQITLISSKAMIATVWLNDAPVVTFGVAAHSRAGASLWRSLIETQTVTGKPLDCPPEPWIAARLEPGAARASADALAMIGDLERCVGWAFMESR